MFLYQRPFGSRSFDCPRHAYAEVLFHCRHPTFVLRFPELDGWAISLVKLDIEGSEYDVLKNSSLLSVFRPSFVLIEMHKGFPDFSVLFELFSANRYGAYTVFGQKYVDGMPIPEENLFFIDVGHVAELGSVFGEDV